MFIGLSYNGKILKPFSVALWLGKYTKFQTYGKELGRFIWKLSMILLHEKRKMWTNIIFYYVNCYMCIFIARSEEIQENLFSGIRKSFTLF